MKPTNPFEATLVNKTRWEMSEEGIKKAGLILHKMLAEKEVVLFSDIAMRAMKLEGDMIPKEFAGEFSDAAQAVADERFRIREFERDFGVHDLIFIDEDNYPAMPGRCAKGFCVRNSDVGVNGVPSGKRELLLRFGRAKGSMLKIAQHLGADEPSRAVLAGKIDNLFDTDMKSFDTDMKLIGAGNGNE